MFISHPIFNIFGKAIPGYSLMGLTGFVLALIFMALRCRALKLSTENAIYIFTLSFVSALIGAKIFFIFTVFPDFIRDFHLLFSDSELFISKYVSGGMVFYGGLIFAVITAFHLAKSYKVKLSDYLPVLLPSVALVSGFGRIGCFMAGCCYGIESSSPIAVIFPPEGFAPSGVPLLPVQLFEAGFDFILFGIMIYVCSRPAARHWAIRLYLLFYSVMRFCLEFIRGDAIRGFLGPFSTSQWISILLILIVLALSLAEHIIAKRKILKRKKG